MISEAGKMPRATKPLIAAIIPLRCCNQFRLHGPSVSMI